MYNKTSVYLVSKPLQYMNATNIPDANNKICLMINSFYKAKIIYMDIKHRSTYWNDILFFDKFDTAFQWMMQNIDNIDVVFLYGDVGFKNILYLRKIKHKEIYVYEEGSANYSKNIRKGLGYLHYLLSLPYLLTGNMNCLGGSKYVRGLYVYRIEDHKRSIPRFNKPRLMFKKPFIDHLKECRDSEYFKSDVIRKNINLLLNKKVIVYASSWKYNPKISIVLRKYNAYIKILKLHPHIKTSSINGEFDLIVENNVLAELLVFNLCTICSEVILIIEDSSIETQIEKSPNMEIKNMNNILKYEIKNRSLLVHR